MKNWYFLFLFGLIGCNQPSRQEIIIEHRYQPAPHHEIDCDPLPNIDDEHERQLQRELEERREMEMRKDREIEERNKRRRNIRF